MDLAAWTAKLLITAALLGHYAPPRDAPTVVLRSAAVLAARFCAGACRPHGAYLPGEGILLDEALDLDGSPKDRSILLHELVHYLQDTSGRFSGEPECERWRDREIEAYRLQDRYLSRYDLGVGNVAAALEVAPAACRVPDAAAAAAIQLYGEPPP
jgi:hypothetical protein